MPIYEYRCRKCEYEFEVFEKSIQDQSGALCPKCGDEKAERLYSTFAAHGSAREDVAIPPGGCGRCGDPDGSCPWNG